LTHPSVSVCGSSTLLSDVEETACSQTSPDTPIFSYEKFSTSSSQHDADFTGNYDNPKDDAFATDGFTDVLFGDETSESFATFTAPFAGEGGASAKDEEEAGGLSVHVMHVTATAHEDSELVDQFVTQFLDPCFTDQPKGTFVAPAASSSAVTTVAPLKARTNSRYFSPSFSGGAGAAGVGRAAAGLTVPVALSVSAIPTTTPASTSTFSTFASFPTSISSNSVPSASTSSTFSSFLAIPTVPMAATTSATVVTAAPSFGDGSSAPVFRCSLRPSDFKTKKEYRRKVAIPRYLAKRKRRQFKKEPIYATRTTAAHRRPRSNGKFSRSEAFVSASALK